MTHSETSKPFWHSAEKSYDAEALFHITASTCNQVKNSELCYASFVIPSSLSFISVMSEISFLSYSICANIMDANKNQKLQRY